MGCPKPPGDVGIGEGGAQPLSGLVFPLPPLPAPWAPCGGAPAHLGAAPFPHLAHAALWGRWAHLVGPRDPPGGPGTLPIDPKLFR